MSSGFYCPLDSTDGRLVVIHCGLVLCKENPSLERFIFQYASDIPHSSFMTGFVPFAVPFSIGLLFFRAAIFVALTIAKYANTNYKAFAVPAFSGLIYVAIY